MVRNRSFCSDKLLPLLFVYQGYLGHQYKALLVGIEHRFYGESVPYNSLAVSHANSAAINLF